MIDLISDRIACLTIPVILFSNVSIYCSFKSLYGNRVIGLVGRVFANGLEHLDSIPGHVIRKTQKMVLYTSLLNTQQYNVRIKGEVEQSWERRSALPNTLV